MKMCSPNEPPLSREMLRAFALGELHGDGAAEIAAHLEHCAGCARRVRALIVLERCDRALRVVAAVEEGSKIAAAWQRTELGILALRQKLIISLTERHDRLVRWADGLALVTQAPVLQWLALGESMQIVKEIPISPGESSLPCLLRVFRNAQGGTRIGVSFGDHTGQDFGVLRAVLCCGDVVKEAKDVADVSDIAFDAQLSPGDYVVQLRGQDREYRIGIAVD